MQKTEGSKYNSIRKQLRSYLIDASGAAATFVLTFSFGLIMAAIGLALYF